MAENTPPARDYPLGLAPQTKIEWPLLADSLDTDGGNALVPLMGDPIVDGVGFVASLNHGVDVTKLLADTPAPFVPAESPISLFAKVRKRAEVIYNPTETFVCLGHPTSDRPKIELCVIDDVTNSVLPQFCVRSWGMTNVLLGRAAWRFEFRAPEKLTGDLPAPQALCFLDAATLLLAVAEQGSDSSVLYRVDLTTGEYTGRARSDTYKHINSLHVDPDGVVWAVAWVSGADTRFSLDLAASFSTGAITAASTWSVTGVPTSSLSFATVGGVEYVILSAYATSGTPRAYVFPRTAMAGAASDADAVVNFRTGLYVQDTTQRASDGRLYASKSLTNARIDAYDLAAILAAGVNDTTPSPVATYPAPSTYCEGLDFHPATDRLWCATEGRAAVRDAHSHLAVWSAGLASTLDEWNSFLIDYADGFWQVRCNGRLMTKFAFTANITNPAVKLAVGASPATTFSMRQRVLYNGEVKALALSDVPFTAAQLDALETL